MEGCNQEEEGMERGEMTQEGTVLVITGLGGRNDKKVLDRETV